MRKRKMVYICDHCGTVALGILVTSRRRYHAPYGWEKLGNEDICPMCWTVYEKFKREIAEGGDDD